MLFFQFTGIFRNLWQKISASRHDRRFNFGGARLLLFNFGEKRRAPDEDGGCDVGWGASGYVHGLQVHFLERARKLQEKRTRAQVVESDEAVVQMHKLPHATCRYLRKVPAQFVRQLWSRDTLGALRRWGHGAESALRSFKASRPRWRAKMGQFVTAFLSHSIPDSRLTYFALMCKWIRGFTLHTAQNWLRIRMRVHIKHMYLYI